MRFGSTRVFSYAVSSLTLVGRGFLRRGNATLFIGVEAARVDEVLNLIQANCPLRTEPNPPDAGIPMYGATVFVLETVKFVHI
jgi:uncharacterized protein YaaQ